MPGPACYGRGGDKPTVTDADVLLGYVGANSFLGGGFQLDAEKAREAIARLAHSLGVSAARCAWGIHDLVNGAMSEAATMHAADYGVDPSSLPVIAFGGAGPVHAYGVARKLNARKVICPAGAGVTSAVGLLIAPVAVDVSASFPVHIDRLDFTAIEGIFARLEKEGRDTVLQAGVDAAGITLSTSADLRYVGQGHEIAVALPSFDLGVAEFRDEVLTRFADNYAALFGRTVADSPVEAITWRLRVSGPKGKPADISTDRRAGARADALKAHRAVYFDEEQSFVNTPVYDYYALAQDVEVAGPAIIEQAESTIVVGPRGTAHVDAHHNLVMHIN
jgi:N-methylhydantoinase A